MMFLSANKVEARTVAVVIAITGPGINIEIFKSTLVTMKVIKPIRIAQGFIIEILLSA